MNRVFAADRVGERTSACGAMIPYHQPLSVVGNFFPRESTQSRGSLPLQWRPTASTSSVRAAILAPAEAIAEIRRLTSLTWDQLAKIFGVTRRAIHFWASGKRLTSDHTEKLARVGSVIRRIDRGSCEENTAVLLSPVEQGILVIDLLGDGRYEDVVRFTGTLGHVRPAIDSGNDASSRLPLGGPDTVVATVPENVHKELEVSRRGRTVRARSRG